MSKVTLGPQTLVYPMPAFLIGANVDGRANFMTAAWAGIACSEPPMIGVAIRPQRHTYAGVEQNGTFSVNVPSANLVRQTDFCGIRSGVKFDKAALCGFTVFYGKLHTAPLIEECPVNLECRVVEKTNLGSHTHFIGRIEETHVSDDCLSDGLPDATKIAPIVYSSGAMRSYHALGETLAKAFSIGREIKG